MKLAKDHLLGCICLAASAAIIGTFIGVLMGSSFWIGVLGGACAVTGWGMGMFMAGRVKERIGEQ
jgi:hypothetical protein